ATARGPARIPPTPNLEHAMAELKELAAAGQSVWLDFIRRDMLTNGELAALIDEGVTGVTSNPSIFENAIAGSNLYDAAIAAADGDALSVFESLAVEDVRGAADALRRVYDATNGADGYVSLEVSPTLADDAEGTIADALRLWAWVDRPNLMVKVPATSAGIVAIEELTAAGVNINATLMFSLADYDAVAMAYVRGAERSEHPERLASVASFFVSRVDGKVDAALNAIGTDEALSLRGMAAVANAKLAYRRYQEVFEGSPFDPARSRGARAQRALWASTSTKDPAYSDVLYVAELVGPNTVNTIPPATIDAFRDHGIVDPAALTSGVDDAEQHFARLASLGIDFDAITEELQVEGVASFAGAFDGLLAAIETQRGRS
ncbi:MAG: transaldolase, partial [Actinomycetota bacterium]|nr:transaldolase [Actinomycetota bacterium]